MTSTGMTTTPVLSKDVKDAKDVKTSRVSHVRYGSVLLALFTSFAFFTSLLRANQGQPQAPTFRSKVEIVQLDVSVLDKHRQPVRGLTQGDFVVLEDGKPQKIVGFSAFDIDDDAPPATGWMKDVPPDVTTNESKPESRLFIIVLDDAMIPQEPFSIKSAKAVANSIIDKLGPDDLTAIVFSGDNRKAQDFTSDKTKLRAALDRFNPGLANYRFGLDSLPPPTPISNPSMAQPPEDVDLYFYQSSVRTLQTVADFLIAVPNRRKSLFWVSPGVPLDIAGAMPTSRSGDKPVASAICLLGSDAACDNPYGVWGTRLPPPVMADLQRKTEQVFLNAQRANVTIYPIDPAGLDGMNQYLAARLGPGNLGVAKHKATVVQDYLAAAAANTGGRTVMNTNDFEPGITGIFEENASYYLIGFERGDVPSDGKLHKLQVKVNRDDVEVRTRSGYYAPEPEKPNKKLDAMTPEAAALARSMAGILPLAGMPLKASVAAFAVPGQRLSTVTVVLGVKQPVPEAAKNGRITETTELLTSAFTPEGDPRGTAQRHTAKVQLRAGADGEAAYEVLAKIDLAPGRYQLRLAAHNTAAAKDGSVFVDVIVPDYSNTPFSATPVVLSASPGRVSAPKDLFNPLLPLVPTAERQFTVDDKVTAFMRLYQSGQKPVEKVQLTIRIKDAQDQLKVNEMRTIAADQFPAAGAQMLSDAPMTGPPLPNRPQISPTPTPASKDAFANLGLRTADVKFQIPLSQLSLGPHLLTIEATLGTTTIRRDVRLTVK